MSRVAAVVAGPHSSPPELIVKFLSGVTLPFGRQPAGAGDRSWQKLLAWTQRHGATVRPCFPLLAERVRRALEAECEDSTRSPSIDRFVSVLLPDAVSAPAKLLDAISLLPGVGAVSVAPRGGPPPHTPDHTALQTYLETGDHHLGARDAWRRPGGAGKAVKLCVCDHGFRATHEDLPGVTVVTGEVPDENGLVGRAAHEHGTSVIGLIAALQDAKGVTGIAHDVSMSFACVDDQDRKGTIDKGIDSLGVGDILLMEMQAEALLPGAGGAVVGVGVPQEYDDAIREAIKAATWLGIVVVEAAGNSGVDLGTVPFRRSVRGQTLVTQAWQPGDISYDDSRAIIVGAGRSADQTRVEESNWGFRVNCQGWGDSIVTTGSSGSHDSDLPDANGNPPSAVARYSRVFGATSGAAAMVGGVVACLQGVCRGAGQRELKPKYARRLLSDPVCGTPQPQQDALVTPIGPLPNLEALSARTIELQGPGCPGR
jgi:subtilase family protein